MKSLQRQWSGLRRSVIDHGASVQNHRAVGQFERGDGVLFHDDGGDALVADDGQCLGDFLHDDRGQPFIGFVEQEHLDVAGQCTGNGEHLLFAARECYALLLAPLAQTREKLVDPLE